MGPSKRFFTCKWENFRFQQFDTKSNGVFDGDPHCKSRMGTPSLGIKARAAQAQQVGKGWFWFRSQSLKKQCFTMIPILSNLQLTLGFQGLGMAKLLWLPSHSARSVRLDTRRSGDSTPSWGLCLWELPGRPAFLSTRIYFQLEKRRNMWNIEMLISTNPEEPLWLGFSTTPPNPKKSHILRPEPPKGFRPEAQETKRGKWRTFHKKNSEMWKLKIMKWRKNKSTFKQTCIFPQ